MSSGGLLRYRSAPSSSLSEVCDDFHATDHASSPESMLARFLSDFNTPLPTSPAPLPARRPMEHVSTLEPCSNLSRHSSSPAGFFSHSNVDNGFGVMTAIGGVRNVNDTMGEAGLQQSTINRQISFSSRQSSIMSQTSEIGSECRGGSSPEESNLRSSNGNAGCYISGHSPGTFAESSMLSDNFLAFRRDLNQSKPQNRGLTHQFSLPKTSSEMAAIENFLQFQDSVPFKIRAKRGCATHPRSIAERVRRTRISERMRKLQVLVPNMDKQTNTADMLDFAVEYIKNLQKLVKDQVLLGMQQKLDDLCMQMSSAVDWPVKSNNKMYPENDVPSCLGLPELNSESGITPLFKNFDKPKECVIESSKDEMFKSSHVNNAEQEERRMSGLSDFCGSVTSSVDIQLSTLAAEQDYFNLRRECEEKDSTIKELTAAIHASGVVSSKRITELEEIIRRKNMVINKMKKDMLSLEQQVIQLTRLRRKSSPTLSNSNDPQLPFMSSNILYDMSSTSPSSSDSDSPSGNTLQHNGIEEKRTQSLPSMKMNSFRKSVDKPRKQQCLSPLKENHMNQRTESNDTSRPGQLGPSSGDFKRIRRHARPESRTPISQRKWV